MRNRVRNLFAPLILRMMAERHNQQAGIILFSLVNNTKLTQKGDARLKR